MFVVHLLLSDTKNTNCSQYYILIKSIAYEKQQTYTQVILRKTTMRWEQPMPVPTLTFNLTENNKKENGTEREQNKQSHNKTKPKIK